MNLARVAVCLLIGVLGCGSALAQPRAGGVPAQPSADRAGAPVAATPPLTLYVGDPAPPLTVARWAKGPPVGPFEPGRVYIVEFWASWCAPCVRAIPKLTELQAAYGARGLSVVAIASQETAPEDLTRLLSEQGDRIGYSVGLDERGQTHRAWMIASGQRSIPTAFIVDGQSRVVWVGHPLDGMDVAVARVIDGGYDLDAARVAFRRRADLMLKAQPIIDRYRAAIDEDDHSAAIAAATELIDLDPREFAAYAVMKFQEMAVGLKDYSAAYAYADQAIAGPIGDDPDSLTLLASTICDDPNIERRDFAVARRAAARANELTGGRRPRILSVLARIAAESGDFAGAIELQTRAVSLTEDASARADLQKRLEDYRSRAQQK